MPDIIKRTIDAPQLIRRSSPDEQTAQIEPIKGIIEGRPIVYEKRTAIGDYFYEEIARGALDGADLSDIKFMINHNDSMIPLARHRRGKRSSMDTIIDAEGMGIKTNLDLENNTTARELCSAVTRGDIDGMSFAFGIMVSGEEWYDLDKPMPIRRITKISKVCEISAVNDAAYPQTSIYARSSSPLDNDKIALDNARAAALENEKRGQNDDSQASLKLAKEKFLFVEAQKHYGN